MVGVRLHGPELEHRERAAGFADTLLPKEHRSFGGQFHRHGRTQEHRARKRSGTRGCRRYPMRAWRLRWPAGLAACAWFPRGEHHRREGIAARRVESRSESSSGRLAAGVRHRATSRRNALASGVGVVRRIPRGDRSNKTQHRTPLEPSDHVGAWLRLPHRLGQLRNCRRVQAAGRRGDHNEHHERLFEAVGPFTLAHQRIAKQILADQMAPLDRRPRSRNSDRRFLACLHAPRDVRREQHYLVRSAQPNDTQLQTPGVCGRQECSRERKHTLADQLTEFDGEAARPAPGRRRRRGLADTSRRNPLRERSAARPANMAAAAASVRCKLRPGLCRSEASTRMMERCERWARNRSTARKYRNAASL